MRILTLLFLLSILVGCRQAEITTESALTSYIDVMTGTGAATTPSALRHGAGTEVLAQTIPAVGIPHAMTNWTPQTRATEKKCLAPYYYSDSLWQGIRGTHWLSGSCVQDYGSLTIMAQTGAPKLTPEKWSVPFDHNRESAWANYYEVTLSNQVQIAMTAGARSAILEFTLPGTDSTFLHLMPNSDETEGFVRILPEERRIEGYNPVHRIYQGWGQAAGFSGYFVAIFDQDFEGFGVWDTLERNPQLLSAAQRPGLNAYAAFGPGKRNIKVKIGTSFTSIEAAGANLDAEIPAWDLDALRLQTDAAWENLLKRVEIKGGSKEDKRLFYTALYHSLLQPRIASDASGTYTGFAEDSTVHKATDFVYYDDFSAWDTYRALHPLYNLLYPEHSRDMVRSLIAKAEQGGWMPIFPCWGNYTSAMIGDHLSSIIADAYVKGIRDFDQPKAYMYLRRNAFESPADYQTYLDGKGRRALGPYLQNGFVPMDEPIQEAFHKNEQVSRTLEYAYDDFTLAQLAKALGQNSDYELLMQRAQNYRNVYDASVGYMRGKFADGSWHPEFNASEKMLYITEGTPRHYTWYVPQDVPGLIELMGGASNFTSKLDTLFDAGHYWHGNEPGHHIPFLYNYGGQPQKTQTWVRRILREEYGLGPGGLSGNDDSGQMSAWAVWASIGLYPVCPGSSSYALSSPLFPEVTLHLPGGKPFTIKAAGAPEKVLIGKAVLNGKQLDTYFLEHSDLLNGGELVLELE